MSARIGIELAPDVCRIAEVDGAIVGPGRMPATRVRSFATVARTDGGRLKEALLRVRGRRAAAVVWGSGVQHRQVVVNDGSYEQMRSEALAIVRDAGLDTTGVLADVAPTSTAIRGASRQPVMLAIARAAGVSAAIGPIREAGLPLHSIVTPGDALVSLARARRSFATGGLEAYVALEARAACIALVRNASLLSAYELAWGFVDASSLDDEHNRRHEIAARLAEALGEFVSISGAASEAMTQVSICGSLPDLRTMAVALMERMDVEVETLDSLFGIDAERLPEPAAEFRDRAAELRLAWAAAADWRGPMNLLRHRLRRQRRATAARAAVAAGVVGMLGTGAVVLRSDWWQMRPRRAPQQARSAPASPASRAPQRPPDASRPAGRTDVPARGTPAGSSASDLQTRPQPEREVPRAAAPAVVAAPPSQGPPTAASPSINSGLPPSAVPSPAAARPAAVGAPVLTAAPSRIPTASPTTPAPARTTPPPSRAPVPPRSAREASERPIPLDAALAMILYSGDRKLAIVNGRIVGIGDEIAGARVVDITRDRVFLRDTESRLRSLTLAMDGLESVR